MIRVPWSALLQVVSYCVLLCLTKQGTLSVALCRAGFQGYFALGAGLSWHLHNSVVCTLHLLAMAPSAGMTQPGAFCLDSAFPVGSLTFKPIYFLCIVDKYHNSLLIDDSTEICTLQG